MEAIDMKEADNIVPPYTFKRFVNGDNEVFTIEIKGYKKFKIFGREQWISVLNGNDSDQILRIIVKYIERKGKKFNHEKPVKNFYDAVVTFALFDDQDIYDAFDILREKGYVLSRDMTAGIFPKQSKAPILKDLKHIKPVYRGKDVEIVVKGKRLLYMDFIKLKNLFNIFRFYINNWETPPLLGEFKYGYIAKAPYI